jgi:deazaflavin-dependent oxidoreductase (nitroreductase family)
MKSASISRDYAVRVTKRQLVIPLQKYLVNPIAKLVAGYLPGTALLETTGRKTGLPRRTPISNGLSGDVFWIVSEQGRRSQYVKNIQADPRVRIRVRGRWRSGRAQVMPDDDPRARQRTLPRLNALFVRMMGDELLSVRVDLDP